MRDVAVGVQRLADEVLGHERAVGVGGVDEVDPELHRAAQHGDRAVVVVRLAPAALAEDLHGAVAEAADLEVAAEGERAGREDGLRVGHAPILPVPRGPATPGGRCASVPGRVGHRVGRDGERLDERLAVGREQDLGVRRALGALEPPAHLRRRGRHGRVPTRG